MIRHLPRHGCAQVPRLPLRPHAMDKKRHNRIAVNTNRAHAPFREKNVRIRGKDRFQAGSSCIRNRVERTARLEARFSW